MEERNLFKEIAERLQMVLVEEEEEEIKKPIGKISESLKEKFVNWKNENEDFVIEVRFKKEILEKKVQREMDELFRIRFEELAKRKESLWNSIREELNIDSDISLNLDPSTGVISEWVSNNEIVGD